MTREKLREKNEEIKKTIASLLVKQAEKYKEHGNETNFLNNVQELSFYWDKLQCKNRMENEIFNTLKKFQEENND